MTPISYRLDKSLPFTAWVPCQASLPLVPAQEGGEWEKFSFWVVLTTGPRFATWTLHAGYGLQTHPTGSGLLLLTQTGYKLDTWITCPIANVSDEKNKE